MDTLHQAALAALCLSIMGFFSPRAAFATLVLTSASFVLTRR